jgi:hypothetical protein
MSVQSSATDSFQSFPSQTMYSNLDKQPPGKINFFDIKPDAEVIEQENGLYTAKTTIAIEDPNTGEEKEYVLTRGDIKINERISANQVKAEVARIAEQFIRNGENTTMTIIKLGLTHFTPGSTTKKVDFDNINHRFIIGKESGTERTYTPIVTMGERTDEIMAKCQLWNNLNAIDSQDHATLPERLQTIKDKIPNGTITATEQSTINTFQFKDNKWLEYNSDEKQWIDVATNRPATKVPLHLPFQIKDTAKNLDRNELSNILGKVQKWDQKLIALNTVHTIGIIWTQNPPEAQQAVIIPAEETETDESIQELLKAQKRLKEALAQLVEAANQGVIETEEP